MIGSNRPIQRLSTPVSQDGPITRLAQQCEHLPVAAEIRSKEEGLLYVKGEPKRVTILSRRNSHRALGLSEVRKLWKEELGRESKATGASGWSSWSENVWWPTFADAHFPTKDGAKCVTVGSLHAMRALLRVNAEMARQGVSPEARADGFTELRELLSQVQRAATPQARATANEVLDKAALIWIQRNLLAEQDLRTVMVRLSVSRDSKSAKPTTTTPAGAGAKRMPATVIHTPSPTSVSSASAQGSPMSAYETQEAHKRLMATTVAVSFRSAMTATGSVPHSPLQMASSAATPAKQATTS